MCQVVSGLENDITFLNSQKEEYAKNEKGIQTEIAENEGMATEANGRIRDLKYAHVSKLRKDITSVRETCGLQSSPNFLEVDSKLQKCSATVSEKAVALETDKQRLALYYNFLKVYIEAAAQVAFEESNSSPEGEGDSMQCEDHTADNESNVP